MAAIHGGETPRYRHDGSKDQWAIIAAMAASVKRNSRPAKGTRAATLSAARSAARVGSMEGLPPVPILVVSGSRGVGKTTLILGLARELGASGLRVGGIASPSERGRDGRPLAIDALDLGTGERRRLASRGPGGGADSADAAALAEGKEGREGLPLSFSTETFDWAERRFREEARGDFDLVALDEIGWIEVDEGRGFFPLVGLVTAVAGPGRRFILTVRESRARKLLAFLGRDKACFLRIDDGNRDELPSLIGSWCGERTQAPSAGPAGSAG